MRAFVTGTITAVTSIFPVLPILEIKDDAEEVYLRQHKELMKRATIFHDLIQDEATKKEVA